MKIMAQTQGIRKFAIIIDPIFRGSRLHYSALAAMASWRNGIHPVIVTRVEYETDHYKEIFQGISHSIISTFNLPKGFWYGKMTWRNICKVLRILYAYCRSPGCEYIYFTGWNEWFTLGNVWLLLAHRRVKLLRMLTIDYAPEYLIRDRMSILKTVKGFAKRGLMTLLLARMANLRLLILDERVLNPEWSRVPPRIRKQIRIVVDPAVARVLLPSHNLTRKATVRHGTVGSITVTLIGRQSRRKGLSDIVKYLEKYKTLNGWVRFIVVGQLDTDTEKLRPRIEKHVGNRIYWRDEYVSEEEVYYYYERSDYVMLPYTRDFSGSSGVMANAVMHHKPVITTDHGLVGYRTKTYGIGITYVSGDVENLRVALDCLPSPHEARYEKMVANCVEMSKKVTPDVYMKEFAEAALS